jgi:DNA-binding NtrC family response regulator
MIPHLLIVDDETDIRNSLSRQYKLQGYDVEIADKSALEFLEKKPFQVVISDIKMPGIDGIELLRRIRIEYLMTRVIIMEVM